MTPRLLDSEGLLSFVRASRTQSPALMGQRQLSGHSAHWVALLSNRQRWGTRGSQRSTHPHPVAQNKRHMRAFLAYERAHKVAPARGGPLPPLPLLSPPEVPPARQHRICPQRIFPQPKNVKSGVSREGQGRGTRASLTPACTVNRSGCTQQEQWRGRFP